MDAAARQISLQTTTGEVAVAVDAKAKVLRVAPGATNLTNAAAIELTDINVGDRLRARGRMADDQKSLAALEIVVISQSDIASKQAADRADWDRRGATGIVADVTANSVHHQRAHHRGRQALGDYTRAECRHPPLHSRFRKVRRRQAFHSF